VVRYNPYLAELAENKVQDDGGPVVLQVSIYFFFFDLFEGQISQKKGDGGLLVERSLPLP